jgi:hypothetical protein
MVSELKILSLNLDSVNLQLNISCGGDAGALQRVILWALGKLNYITVPFFHQVFGLKRIAGYS